MIDKKRTIDGSGEERRAVPQEVEKISGNKKRKKTEKEKSIDDAAMAASGSGVPGDGVDSGTAGYGDRSVEGKNGPEKMDEKEIKKTENQLLDENAAEVEREENNKLKDEIGQFLSEEEEGAQEKLSREESAELEMALFADGGEKVEPERSADGGEMSKPERSAKGVGEVEPEHSADDGEMSKPERSAKGVEEAELEHSADDGEMSRPKRSAKGRKKVEPELSADDMEEVEPERSADEGEEVEPERSADEGEMRKPRRSAKGRKKVKPELLADDGEELEPELSADDGEELEPDLSADDGEELEEEPLTEEEKAERRRKRKKVVKIVLGTIVGVIAAVYLGFAVFFMSHFYFNTKINGTDFALKTVGDVETFMSSQVDSYALTLEESDGTEEVINGSEIAVSYKQSEELAKQLKAQNPFLWPRGLWEDSEITASVGVNYDEQKLSEKLASLDCMKEENQIAPVSSKPEFDGNQFVPKEEETGSQIEKETFSQKVREYIEGFQDTLDMTEESCYVKPQYLQDSPEVKEACDKMNQYLKASITYTMGSNEEVVDKAVISQWLSTDDKMAVTFNSDKVTEYVTELAKKYNTRGSQRTFVSGNGNTVKVEGGDYGWIIDKEAESKALLENIQKGEVVSREPAYAQKAASHDGADWGNTYVEVDLTNQNVYLFVNGSLIVSAPIVTGKPSAGDATPQGVYLIKYCTRNATLRGPKKSDGSYEWESPVSFWMPFNGGIGLHDAPWQAAFGGSRYLTHGSHGCVNLQYNVAQTIYNNVEAGTPVVCHY